MEDSGIRPAVLRACQEFMGPLARFLVRCGVSYKEFAQVAKVAFVEVVSHDYGLRGRQTNISRVAVLTGLTRKEVSRIRKSQQVTEAAASAPRCRPEQVLEAWHRLEEYTDSKGYPLVIPADGDKPCFSELVKTVGGDIPFGAMLKELIRAGSVEETSKGQYKAVSRSFMPDVTDPESIVIAGEAIHDLIETISWNLFQSPNQVKRLERRVYSDQMDPKEIEKFKNVANEKAKDLLEELDDLVASRETWVGTRKKQNRRVRVGLGIYLFEDRSGD